MNSNLKIAIAAGAGFIVGYFLANKQNETYYFNKAEESLNEMSEELNKLLTERNEAREVLAAIREEKDLRTASEVMSPEAAEALSSYQGNGGFVPVDVHAVTEKIQYSNYNTEEAEKLKPREVEQKENIEIITPQEFSESKYGYEQPTYEYYKDQDILASARIGEGKVDDDLRQLLLGSRSDLLSRETFWQNLGDDAFYLRNHDVKVELEIILAEDGTEYEDVVEGAGGNG
jgi:hypothetical protein